jgi:FkbM family methyltransferase
MQATPEDVRHAFRLLLGREPDAGGRETFERLIEQSPMPPIALAEAIMRSEEYRLRQSDELVRNEMGGYSVFSRRGDALIGSHLGGGEPYEPYVMKHFDAAVASASVVLDIGANIGIFSMRAASRIRAGGRVIAVEPLPQNLHALYAGIRDNGFRHVEVLPVAASSDYGLVSMVCHVDSSNGILRAEAIDGMVTTTAPAHRLDRLLAALEALDVIKMDIEGHEPFAWQGLSGLLQRFRPVVFTEFSPVAMRQVDRSPEDFAASLLAYSPWVRVLHRRGDPVPCATAPEIMREWESANQQEGLGGELHLDLQLDPGWSPAR